MADVNARNAFKQTNHQEAINYAKINIKHGKWGVWPSTSQLFDVMDQPFIGSGNSLYPKTSA